MPQFIKSYLELKPVQKDEYVKSKKTGKKYTIWQGNPNKIHSLRNLNPLQRFITTYADASDEEKSTLERLLKTTTGIRPQKVEVESEKYRRSRDIERLIEDMLIRQGTLKRFERTYVPKSK